jgi:hypothetical protein
MKNDSKVSILAEVDVAHARYSNGFDLGIDFANEIDVWSQMEFKARHQIKHLKQYGTHNKHVVLKEIHSYFYATRQTLEE